MVSLLLTNTRISAQYSLPPCSFFEQLIHEHTFLAQLVRAGDRKVTDPGLICGLTSRYILMTPVVATTLAATTAAAYIDLGKDERI